MLSPLRRNPSRLDTQCISKALACSNTTPPPQTPTPNNSITQPINFLPRFHPHPHPHPRPHPIPDPTTKSTCVDILSIVIGVWETRPHQLGLIGLGFINWVSSDFINQICRKPTYRQRNRGNTYLCICTPICMKNADREWRNEWKKEGKSQALKIYH